MLKLEGIKKGLSSVDNRPVIIWEGTIDDGNRELIGSIFRVVLSKKGSIIVEAQSGRNAMEEPVWIKTTDHRADAEILSRILMNTLTELNKYLTV